MKKLSKFRIGRRAGMLAAIAAVLCAVALLVQVPALFAQVPGTPDAPPQPPLTAQQTQPLNPKLPTVFIAGDSTARNKEYLGWGDHLAHYFDTSRINVANRARAGRSSRTFLKEGAWAAMLQQMKPGDFVLIQFGHNDGGDLGGAKPRGTLKGIGDETKDVTLPDGSKETVRTFGGYLRQYIADTRAKRATPILLTLTVRNVWTNGKIERDMGYDAYLRQIAAAEHVQLADMGTLAAAAFESLGQEKTALLFPIDHTHTSSVGAELNAAMVTIALRGLKDSALSGYLNEKGKTVTLQSAVAASQEQQASRSRGTQAANAAGQTTLLVDVDHRATVSLDGEWHTIVDPYGSGLYGFHNALRTDGYFMNAPQENNGRVMEYNFATSPTLKVPGDWNTQRASLMYYEGPVWYERDFDYHAKAHTRVFLHIGAANYRGYVWVNAKKVCQHEGGFTPFDCEVTDAVHEGKNFAVIAVDDTRLADGVPTLQTDWWNYGGLTRDVSLVEVPEQFVDDYDLHLRRGSITANGGGVLEGWVHVEGAKAGTPVEVDIPEAKLSAKGETGADGRAAIHIVAEKLSLWSPENPHLYKVTIQSGADSLQDDIGFRTIEVSGTKILLNGKPIFLRGVCIHGERPYTGGRVSSEKDAQTLLGWAHELGANYVRLAHYPHDQRMTRLADKMGILVWSEIPVYWAVEFDNPEVLAKAQQQLHEMIRRDRDKASVILWSIANETPNNPTRTKFLTTLAGNAHELDPTRLVTAALLVRTQGNTKIVDDPLGAALDVIGANEYIGWYEHKPEDADNTVWQIAYQKPMIMSEFGGAAKAGMHGSISTRWTEEMQAEIYRHQIVMFNKIPQLRGLSAWALVDFRSPRRVLPGIQDGYNRKGLISDQGVKKKAFFVLQKAYTEKTVGKAE
ncbi:MAG: glycoside hydrolase family 2 TIM barrel-domain containing protein [Acidobacteriaceae bacterium]